MTILVLVRVQKAENELIFSKEDSGKKIVLNEALIMSETRPKNTFITINGGSVGIVQNEGTIGSSAGQVQYAQQRNLNLAEAAKEIQNLLKQLEQTNPNATENEQITYLNDETSPSFQRKAASALKAAGEAAIDEFLDNPYIKVGKAAIIGWIEAGN